MRIARLRGTGPTAFPCYSALIVSLGILHEPWQLGVLMRDVALLVARSFAINRLAGIDYPT